MTRGTASLTFEVGIATVGGFSIVCILWWGRRWNGDLIIMERRELGCDQVRFRSPVPDPRAGGDRKLLLIIQPWIKEDAFAVHLGVGHVRIPVRDRTPTGVSVKVLSCEP